MYRNPTVAIVGGSLVGPFAELALRRAGLTNVTTYEAMPSAISQSGGVMGLRVEPLSMLDSVGVPLREVVALTDSNVYAHDVVDGTTVRRGVSTFPGMVTSWDMLHQRLASLVDVQYRHKVSDMTWADDRWVLWFSDGTQAEADVVLFADGRKSLGREILFPERKLRYNGYTTWRGLTEPQDLTGFNRYYDIEHGRLFSLTGPLETSGRSYWELSHNLSWEMYACAVGGHPTTHAFVLPHQITETARNTIRRAARHLPQDFQDIVEQSEVAGIPVNDLAFPKRAMHRAGNAVAILLGDALQPVRLQVGAGLNQGLRQASEVAQLLANGGSLDTWETDALNRLAPIVELGRSRAHRNNLGWYEPVNAGRTSAPVSDQWSAPKWVSA